MKKTVLILGASSDLGIELMTQLLKEDYVFVAHYFNNKRVIDNLVSSNSKKNIYPVQADLSNFCSVSNLLQQIDSLNLRPTHIVNLCAEAFQYNRFSDWNSKQTNKNMQLQVFSFAEIVKHYIPFMVDNNYGKIIAMLTSCTIGTPPKNLSEYTTIKYALLGLIKSLASEFGDKGININGVSPAMINTKFVSGVGRKIKEFNAVNNPKHRNLEVEDVVPTICFLLSDDSEFVSGSNINLSGNTD